MKISIAGTGMVGQTLAGKLVQLGHNIYMGTRDKKMTMAREDANRMTGKSFSEWHQENQKVIVENYRDLPSDSEIFINATSGKVSLDALNEIGPGKLNGKIILDVANPLDFSGGMPPTLSVANTSSLAEEIQKAYPESKVVKSLNTMNCLIMVDPTLIPKDHKVFMAGNDANAKAVISSLLKEFGWKEEYIMDLGDITASRGMEMVLPLWMRIMNSLDTSEFNFSIVEAEKR